MSKVTATIQDMTQGLPVYPIRLLNGQTGVVVREALIYETSYGKFTVPEGFMSDGCSMPPCFWIILGHPFDMDFLREAILHDFIYQTQPVDRKTADLIFCEILKPKMGWIRRKTIFRGLRVGGWAAWNKHTENLLLQAKLKALAFADEIIAQLKENETTPQTALQPSFT